MRKIVWILLAIIATLLVAPVFAQQQPVNIGTSANDHSGDVARTAFTKLNANDAELYANVVASVTAGGTDTYAATPDPSVGSLVHGKKLIVTFTNANTGAATFNPNTLGAVALKKFSSGALVDLEANDIGDGQQFLLVYDATNSCWQINIGGGGSGGIPTDRTISTTAPLTGGGDLSANRTFGITQATTSTDGYVNATDWNIFNNKVATSRTISTTAPLSGGGDLSSNRTFSISQATTSTDGYLSSTDWDTFNDKISSLTNGSGTGTSGNAVDWGGNLFQDVDIDGGSYSINLGTVGGRILNTRNRVTELFEVDAFGGSNYSKFRITPDSLSFDGYGTAPVFFNNLNGLLMSVTSGDGYITNYGGGSLGFDLGGGGIFANAALGYWSLNSDGGTLSVDASTSSYSDRMYRFMDYTGYNHGISLFDPNTEIEYMGFHNKNHTDPNVFNTLNMFHNQFIEDSLDFVRDQRIIEYRGRQKTVGTSPSSMNSSGHLYNDESFGISSQLFITGSTSTDEDPSAGLKSASSGLEIAVRDTYMPSAASSFSKNSIITEFYLRNNKSGSGNAGASSTLLPYITFGDDGGESVVPSVTSTNNLSSTVTFFKDLESSTKNYVTIKEGGYAEVNNLKFNTQPTLNDTIAHALVVDNTTGEVKSRRISTMGGGGAYWNSTGSTTLTGTTFIDGAQNLFFGTVTPLSSFIVSANAVSATSTSGNDISFGSGRDFNVTATDSVIVNSTFFEVGHLAADPTETWMVTVDEDGVFGSQVISGGSGGDMLLGTSQTVTAAKLFNSGTLDISNPANTFKYDILGSAIVADRTVTFPLLTGNDVLVTEAFTQTLTNKSLTSPTITGTPILPSTFTIGANSFIRSGAHNLTFTTTGTTGVTLPTSGTLYSTGTTDVSVADGGTGRSTGTTAYALIATGTTATGAQQSLAQGTTSQILVGGGAALPVWTTATGTGSPVRATSPTLVTPVLGTVAAGSILTNATGLPLTTGVTGTLPVANGGTGASSASITAFNNITGFTSAGATGTTSTNLVYSGSPTIVTPVFTTNISTPSIITASGNLSLAPAGSYTVSSKPLWLDDVIFVTEGTAGSSTGATGTTIQPGQISFSRYTGASSSGGIVSSNGISGDPDADDMNVVAGNGYTGEDGDGGNVVMIPGTGDGSGADGNFEAQIHNGSALVKYGSAGVYRFDGLIDPVLLSGTSLTLDDEVHRGKIIYCTSASTITITVPSGLPVGFNCVILQRNGGIINLSYGAVTMFGGKYSTTTTGDIITLASFATNEFISK